MRIFFSLFCALVVLAVGFETIGDSVDSGDLLFNVANDGTVLAPVIKVGGTSYGCYDLAGNPITQAGSPREADPGAPTQTEIQTAIGTCPDNGVVTPGVELVITIGSGG